MPKNNSLPEWEQVLSAAAHLQRLLPGAVLVGGTASAIHADHHRFQDADHGLTDLKARFDEVLAQLESVAGWSTARVRRPVQILGSLDGIETEVRQLIREQPLETTVVRFQGEPVTLLTKEEMLRIKAALILKRNATRDYLDFVALAGQLGPARTAAALGSFDELYPQPNQESALQQLQIQLSNPMPYDLEATRLDEYKNLAPQWRQWSKVKDACTGCATAIFESVAAGHKSMRPRKQNGRK